MWWQNYQIDDLLFFVYQHQDHKFKIWRFPFQWLGSLTNITVNTLQVGFFQKHTIYLYFMSWHWGGTGISNPLSWKTRTSWSCMVNTMVADDEDMQGATVLAQCQKLGNIITGLTYRLLLSFTIISDVYRSFIKDKITFSKYCLTQWISKLPRSFEINWVGHGL